MYCPDSTILPVCFDQQSIGMRYLGSIYFVMTVLSSTGFGDILPVTPPGVCDRRNLPDWLCAIAIVVALGGV